MSAVNVVFLFTLCTSFAKDALKVDIPGQGAVIGTEVSMIRTKKIRAFLGIPYAQPPVGPLRFTPPVIDPLPSWEDVRNATKYAPACVQSNSDYNPQDLLFMHLIAEPEDTYPLDEDCLYLNVFVPSGKGGGFATGSFVKKMSLEGLRVLDLFFCRKNIFGIRFYGFCC